jgi:formylglycine-generating enzyme required for sulfatase activity
MITIPDAGYCIERTEVSRAQYAEFVAAMRIDAGALVPLQKAVAAASPEAACPQYFAASQLASRIDGGADVPVTAIDWCAAFMYCAWRGARLCGGRADGGLYRSSYIGDPQKEEWLHACTQAGHLAYPYGSTAKPVCETKDNGGLEAGLAPVGSHAECQGGYPGVFDMVGNAWEWQHSYSPPDASFRYYEARGASYTDDQPGCQGDWGVGPEGNELIGFRCCASAP